MMESVQFSGPGLRAQQDFQMVETTLDVFCRRAVVASLYSLLTLTLASCSGSSSSTPPITPPGNPVGPNLTLVSSDSFTVGPGQHATEVEPHMLANGTTLVAAFQTGRIAPGGSTDIGWATSTDGGTTWTHGSLPGLTTGEGSGPYDAASDPAVAYDAKHGVWMIASLPLSNTSQTPAVVVSRSTDGLSWQSPVSADPTAPSSDKNWIVCDSWASSPHYGNCYLEWDDPLNSGEILMSTSTDGGLTWGVAGVLYLVGARGLLLLALALLVSGIVSFIALSRQRDAMSAAFTGRIQGFGGRLDAGTRAEDGDGTTSAADPR